MLYVFSMCLVLYSCEYNALVNIDLSCCLIKLVLCLWFDYLFVYHLWYGLLIVCCFIFMFATLEVNATGVVFREDLLKKDESLFL